MTRTEKNRKNRAQSGWKGSRWISKQRRLAIYLRDGFSCAYCGRDLHGAAPADVTLDHLTCRCRGGSDHESNLVTACRSCNSARSDRAWKSYATGGAIERISRLRRKSLTRFLALASAILRGETNVEVERERCAQ